MDTTDKILCSTLMINAGPNIITSFAKYDIWIDYNYSTTKF